MPSSEYVGASAVGRQPHICLLKHVNGRRYACKTIPKMPKRGKASPRYLLKLQQEVDAMQQIGASFDAVYLRVSTQGLITFLMLIDYVQSLQPWPCSSTIYATSSQVKPEHSALPLHAGCVRG